MLSFKLDAKKKCSVEVYLWTAFTYDSISKVHSFIPQHTSQRPYFHCEDYHVILDEGMKQDFKMAIPHPGKL